VSGKGLEVRGSYSLQVYGFPLVSNMYIPVPVVPGVTK